MDATTLRLILLGMGVLLVVGIYLWDRYQRRQWRPRQARRRQRRTAVEPSLGEPVVRERWEDTDPDNETQLSMDLAFNAEAESDYLHIDPALLDEVPRLILQIVVMSKGEPFTLEQVRQAAKSTDMRYGAMNIFHRENDRGQVLFSLANVLEPGTFPKKADPDFSTPGLVLFTQLPGVQDGMAIYSDMLFTAERLVALLDGELRDEARNPLTRQAIEHTRDRILEHRRKIQLLRSRH
ncbi:cell division protein ZipA [endosymbiont of unidentified scaly snail isolate Monju]|uniref:cell division protein ZipA C-terminal FtsZ-binding domain-containing protein n=1 Tax=endosymbiont of unidentified scaly snail isolate Monju TaxID=1248727 RepID=UPI0003892D16|nr:cell division protein ZipA C-terminal FtsZ-binding domain-containing protein [endosymbiont of unidentified scaly snail isolate Monju]BAN69472.1 cell division protein ZipA [endosymbiont of unidentified scaly snail isolate Monju]